jgi:hypothetical protein
MLRINERFAFHGTRIQTLGTHTKEDIGLVACTSIDWNQLAQAAANLRWNHSAVFNKCV